MAARDSRQAKRDRSNEARLARMRAARRRRTIKIAAVIVVVALVFVGIGVASSLGSSSDDKSASPASSTTSAAPTTTGPPSPCPPADGSGPRVVDFKSAPAMCIDPAKNYTATFDTSQGKVVTKLDTKKTPKSTNNFVFLALNHYYDKTQVFRTDTSIDIIQGGSPHTQDNSDQGPGYSLDDEGTGFKYTEGDLVYARTQAPNSASGQYFFATGPNVSNLDDQGTYVTFGHVSEGLDVLKKIIGLGDKNDRNGKPNPAVTVDKVTITAS